MNIQLGRGQKDGFTLTEVLVVIVVITILSSIVSVAWFTLLNDARDSERISDTESVARYLEKQYTELASTSYPTYPSTASLATDITGLANSGLKDALVAPNQTGTTNLSVASSTGSPPSGLTVNTYIYQPILANGNLCTARTEAQPCVRFRLWYLLEENSTARVIESRHQQ